MAGVGSAVGVTFRLGKNGVTRVVDRMEEASLVRRLRPENDRRSILVVLTDQGRETKERLVRLAGFDRIRGDSLDLSTRVGLCPNEVWLPLTSWRSLVRSQPRPFRPA
jgi:DNA-binding MarR family transcriptional regulator